jgi:hypothetical protein
MPKLIVEKSLFEPIEVEVGEKVYRAVPFSPWLIRAVKDLGDKRTDDISYMVDMAALVFGIKADEVEKIDIRALTPAIEYVTEQMQPRKAPASIATPAADEAKIAAAIDEVPASKNELKPEAEPSL